MLVRHGHMEAWVLNHEAASRKLLATLEPNVIRINPRSTVWAPRTLVKSNPKLESPRSVMPTPDSDEGGQRFRFDPGHSFRCDAGQDRSAATLASLSCLK